MKKKPVKKYKRTASDEMRDHYKELFETSISELRFTNMQIEFLYNALDEIRAMTTDNLARESADLSIQRHFLDKLIHARQLFPNPEKL
jgi:hypothetical protein